MVDINFQNLPPQEGFVIDTEKLGSYSLHPEDAGEYEHMEDGMPVISKSGRAFGSNDMHISWIEGNPGEGIPWHTHTPIMYQLYIPFQGRVAVNYKDNDGETHRTETDPGEIVYLPPGAHNKIELIGDEYVNLMVIEYETLITRVEHLVGDSEGLYDPKEDPYYALELDTLRGNVLEMDEDCVERY